MARYIFCVDVQFSSHVCFFSSQSKDMHFGDRLIDESKLTLGVNMTVKVSLSYVGPVMLLPFFSPEHNPHPNTDGICSNAHLNQSFFCVQEK